MLLESTVHLFVVDPDLSLGSPAADHCRMDMHITYANFDRSILEQIDEHYDLLVLDWGLDAPDARGVLDTVRQHAPDTRILALTTDVPATDPIDRGADEFLVEPVTDETLYRTIERLALQKTYEETMSEFYRLATERALLQTELESAVDAADQYQSVTRELDECRERAAAIRDELSSDEFDRALRQLLDD
ncbi:HalX domain-containing protein [Halosolutus halophilus]|uniref:HalX domain-containing protein n=1 Tax=Halosolutus halophilus TaxID=1552990 RepID=UPI00223522D6|nr:HalX domain-containing protein [Halosolutus halophilus]